VAEIDPRSAARSRAGSMVIRKGCPNTAPRCSRQERVCLRLLQALLTNMDLSPNHRWTPPKTRLQSN